MSPSQREALRRDAQTGQEHAAKMGA
jgi:hypothetical protein